MFVCEQTVVIFKSAAKLSLKSWVLDLSYRWIFKCLLIFIINYLQEYFIQVCCIMNLYLHKDKNARQATAIYLQRSFWRQWLLELNTPPPLYGTIDLKNNCFFVTFCLWAILLRHANIESISSFSKYTQLLYWWLFFFFICCIWRCIIKCKFHEKNGSKYSIWHVYVIKDAFRVHAMYSCGS